MGESGLRGGRTRTALVLAALAIAVGTVLIVIAVASQQSAPTPSPAGASVHAPPGTPVDVPAARPQTTLRSADGRGGEPGRGGPATMRAPLPASPPRSITIPAIGVRSAVFAIGKNPDGSLAVPAGARLDQAAWYRNSPTPGQPGPAVLEGHVDSTQGPSVFFKLGDLRPGDTITVTREDLLQVTFTVHAVRDYPKTAFPTEVVYGGDLATPTLRLITCSDFDPTIGHHTGNEVVFAHLTKVTQPRRR